MDKELKPLEALDNLINASFNDIVEIDGFGDITANNVAIYFNNEEHKNHAIKLASYMNIEEQEEIDTSDSKINGMTFGWNSMSVSLTKFLKKTTTKW